MGGLREEEEEKEGDGVTRSGVPCEADLYTSMGWRGRRGANGKMSSGRCGWRGRWVGYRGWDEQMLIATCSQRCIRACEQMCSSCEVAEAACSCQAMCDATRFGHASDCDWRGRNISRNVFCLSEEPFQTRHVQSHNTFTD